MNFMGDVDDLLNKCDVDGDGQISYDEFIMSTRDWKKELN